MRLRAFNRRMSVPARTRCVVHMHLAFGSLLHFPCTLKTPLMCLPIHQRTASALFSALLLAGVCLAQTTERVSVDSSGMEGNGGSGDASISADGRYVAFSSDADNLVPGDTNGEFDVFVHDRQTGVTERVSVDSSGVEGINRSTHASISADGRYVAFDSIADNLIPGDTNGTDDTFVHDRQTGVTERVSVDSSGAQGNDWSYNPSISADGRYVAFSALADNLVPGDTNGKYDVFAHDRQTGVTERVSVDSSGLEGSDWSDFASISADGRYVAFDSTADNLVPGDTNSIQDVFVHDRQTGVTERVSVDSSGVEGNDWSIIASISAGGRYVTFQSAAGNLVLGDTNSYQDIFVHDRQTGVTERVSVGSTGFEGNGWSFNASISADGRYVAFHSEADNLVPGDTNSKWDVFVHDRQTDVTERVSVDSSGVEGNDWSGASSISADGRYVAFHSKADNLVPGDTNGLLDIFVHDRWDGLGANSIYLTGPATAPVGAPVDFTWQATRGNSRYWLAYSRNMNGAVIGGHNFDISTPMTVLATGTNATNGTGSFTSAPVPLSAAGLTIYFEVAARDANGVLYDSNVLAITFN
jgi:archaellum component FlaF (FlaF/FlaG flagellin family)